MNIDYFLNAHIFEIFKYLIKDKMVGQKHLRENLKFNLFKLLGPFLAKFQIYSNSLNSFEFPFYLPPPSLETSQSEKTSQKMKAFLSSPVKYHSVQCEQTIIFYATRE